MFNSQEVEVLIQPDGGDGSAKRKGIVVRQCLNEAWSKCASRWTRTEYRREHRTSGPLAVRCISIEGAERRFGGCARKAVEPAWEGLAVSGLAGPKKLRGFLTTIQKSAAGTIG